MPSLFYRWSERPEQFRLLLLKVVVLLVIHNDYELASAQISVYYNLEPFSCTTLWKEFQLQLSNQTPIGYDPFSCI